jgi:sulfofructose kinase
MSRSKAVICLGVTVVDNVFEVDEIPRVPIKILANNRVRRGGGPASTGAVASARLGTPTELWSWLGKDPEGDFLVAMLDRFGVDHTHTLRRADFATVTAFVLVDKSGERLIVAHGVKETPSSTRHLPMQRIAEAGAVLVDSGWLDGARDVLEAARAAGTPAVLDAESHDVERLIDLARRASYPVFSEEAFERVTRGAPPGVDSCRALSEQLRAPVGVTLGDRGSLWWADGAFAHVPALKVVVKDTTGAGDVFHGAVAAGLAEGMPLLEAARLGSAVAALKCERGDGWDGMPSRAEVEQALRKLG